MSISQKIRKKYVVAEGEDFVVVQVLMSESRIMAYAYDNMGDRTTSRLSEAMKFTNKADADNARTLFEKNWANSSWVFEVRPVSEVKPLNSIEDYRRPPGIYYFHQPK